MTIQNNKCYRIKNEYLLKAFFGYGQPENGVLKDCHGYFSANDQFVLGRAFLEYCYSVIFNIHRLPGCESEWYFQRYRPEHIENIQNISQKRLEDACEELLCLYEFVQEYFKNKNREFLTVKRSLQSFEIDEYRKSANNTGLFFLPCNILTSYSYSLIEGGYYSEYTLRRKIPIKSIVMVDFLLENPSTPGQALYGEDELLVIEKDIKGKICLNKSFVTIAY